MNRRSIIKLLASAPWVAQGMLANWQADAADAGGAFFRLATFDADITPPLGSPLCGGWIPSAEVVDDPLQARGIVLLGGEKPIVLCAIDWVEILNSTYDAWREAIAAAAGTDASHVALHCVHPHNTPWADIEADETIQAADEKLDLVDADFVRTATRRTTAAVKASLAKAQSVTHIGVGQGRVDKVASNRRILGPDGKVASMRFSKCANEQIRNEPEGLIDPLLKTVSFWNEDKPVAALHYYATHPMSYYGDGRVTSDFCGLARDKRQQEQPGVFQVYFTGCAGDVAAGKYNDGSPEMRPILRDRVHAGMVAAWEATRREPISKLDWSVTALKFPVRTEEQFSPVQLRRLMKDATVDKKRRLIAPVILSWLNRADQPVELSCLRIGSASIMHLPGEPFIDYQLFAQAQRRDGFVCVAGYGDGGPGYIPLRESYEQGGYEPTMSFVAPQSERLLKGKIRELLAVLA